MVVAKLGGSLFDLPGVEAALDAWLALQSDPAIVLIVGGGRLVDRLRHSYAQGELTSEEAHWRAIGVMDRNARALCEHLARLRSANGAQRDARAPRVVGEIEQAHCPKRPVFFAPGRFLADVEPGLPGCRLPVGWQVTSDSIAARVAEVLDAGLILLKAVAPPDAQRSDMSLLAERGYVDRWFPRASLRVRSVTFQTL